MSPAILAAATPASTESDPVGSGWSIIIGVGVIILVGVIALISLRITRRWAKTELNPEASARKRKKADPQTAWSEAGQRAAPADLDDLFKPGSPPDDTDDGSDGGTPRGTPA